MNERKLIVVTLEGLVTGALGCYGSSWNATPAIDAIASVGCVWDHCITPSDDPLKVMQRWFSGGERDCWKSWSERGRMELISDDLRLMEFGDGRPFDRTSLVHSLETRVEHPAAAIEQTAFGQLVAAAVESSSQSDPWSLLWLHSRFLTQCWDAPRELMDSEFLDQPTRDFAGPGDFAAAGDFGDAKQVEEAESIAPVFQQTQPPRVMIDQATHPDLVTSWMTTYGLQIQLIDDLIAVMLQSLDVVNTVVIIAGSSGFSLGQNGWIGHRVGPLRSCHTRLPLIVGCDGPLRSSRISSTDLVPSLIGRLADRSLPAISPENWVAQDQEFEPRLVTHGEGQSAVTTSRWFLVRQADQQQRLFLKPDDVEDFNDVSRLRSDVTEQLLSDIPSQL